MGWDLLLLTFGAGLLFFASLGARDLWNPNEPIYGRAVVEMEERGDWLIPTVNDKVFAEKPILYFWSALAASKVLGEVDELSLRIPSAVAGLGCVLLTYCLVLPYAGRRRALLTGALFMTLYQVFWAARSVQMDVLVMASALGVLVPLTRAIDFGARRGTAFALAGLAAGLGFAAKGPVAWVVAGVVVLGYAASVRRLDFFWCRELLIGVAVTLAVSAPWYVLLWIGGERTFLFEVLVRQNFTRFVQAWDHQQPWWYYLQYLFVDYAPWAWLLPAAWFVRPESDRERRLHRLAWIWIFAVLVFFSLSESKRAPYILPIAPAVAILASGVIDRWMLGSRLKRVTRVAAVGAWSLWAVLLLVAGLFALVPLTEVPEALSGIAGFLGLLLTVSGLALAFGVLTARRRPALAPLSLLGGFAALYLTAAVWALPAADSLKSARGFSGEMNGELAATKGTVVSFRFWDWRAGYSYYSRRSILNLRGREELEAYWRSHEAPHVLIEGRHEELLESILPDARLVRQGTVGSRRALLYSRPQPRQPESASNRLKRMADPVFLSGATAIDRADLPPGLSRLLAVDGSEVRFEHRRILAYEVEKQTANGIETELFVDRNGHSLMTVVKPEAGEEEEPTTREELPGPVRGAIQSLLGELPLSRLQREIEWGLPVYAARWDGVRGSQELKVLEDGRILFIELPADEPIPDPVLRIAEGVTVEPMLLDVFVARRQADSQPVRAVLSSGWSVATVTIQ